jgi:putative nucleotidyltransferase with HDIG domain
VTTAPVKLLWHPWRLSPTSLGELSPQAWLYWLAVVGPVAIAAPIAEAHVHGAGYWRHFFILTAFASTAQLLSFQLNRRRVFHPAIVFIVAGALLLPPGLLVLLIIVHCIPDWLKQRYPWYIQTFNIANYTLSGVAAWAVARPIGFTDIGAREAAAGAAAAVTFVVVNRALLVPMLRLGRGLTLRETGLLNIEDVSLELVLAVAAVTLAALWNQSLWLAALALAPLFVIHFTQRAILRVEEANAEIERRTTETLETLSATVDAKDEYTAGHSKRVQRISVTLAEEMGLEAGQIDIVRQAALLHDIGKIGVEDAVLLKRGSLNEAEWTVMRSHPELGARIIEKAGFLSEVVPGIRHHHERPDGRGYPDGLLGDEIPLAARIIHVADALDAMTTERFYRQALSFELAMEEIRRSRGSDFCDVCVDALERAVDGGQLSWLARSRGVLV